MNSIFIKELKGFSNSKISLMKRLTDVVLFVGKEGNIDRNYRKLMILSNYNIKVPAIYNKTADTLDMEYIDGLDIAHYLLYYNSKQLVKFIVDIITKFRENSLPKNYTETYWSHLNKLDYTLLPFNKDELFNRLPKVLDQSTCHGDFTLENIIHAKTNDFYLIDPSVGDYNSWIFDVAKLRQDLDGKWFLRNNNSILDSQLLDLKNTLITEFPEAFDDHLYILMLLRIYLYAVPYSMEHRLLLKEINRLWK